MADVMSGFALAAIGKHHFGNPIPPEWYAAARELEDVYMARLAQLEAANKEWHDKTEWLRKDLQPHELGKHLADVLRERCNAA